MSRIGWMLGVLTFLFTTGASAHSNSAAYLTIEPTQQDQSFALRWDIAVTDLAMMINLDLNGDRKITWGEISAQAQAIKSKAIKSLRINAGTATCGITSHNALELARYSDGAYVSLQLQGHCFTSDAPITAQYRLLFATNPDHRALLTYPGSDDRTEVVLLSKTNATFNLTRSGQSAGLTEIFSRFLKAGVHHLLIGYDHLLFLFTLLLPAVMVRKSGAWYPAKSFSQSLRQVLLLVTAFTLAHSVTLTISALGIIQPLVRWIETLIAFSIALSAVHNLRPLFNGPHWLLAFTVGLVHGFGFANVLQDIGLSDQQIIIPLAAFNLGVELGQTGVVLMLFPVLYYLRKWLFFKPVVLKGGSVTAAIIAAFWVIERGLAIAN